VALALVDIPTSKQLACDFAEHTLWICEEETNDNPIFRAALTTTREFLKGNVSIEEVARTRSDLFRLRYELQESIEFNAKKACLEASWAIALCIRVCCKRELEKACAIIYQKYQPNADSVAYYSSYAMARYAAGTNWDSDNPELKNVARKRGHEASKAETEWQLARIFDYVI
jgi:hypothetical protein